MRAIQVAAVSFVVYGTAACALLGGTVEVDKITPARASLLGRAQVWFPTDIPAMDIKAGPPRPDGFRPGETVECDYVDEKLSGDSPKFACRLGGEDELKVKFGGANGEVYGEVAATRLLWALGFGADAMYPVRVICNGCPKSLGGVARLDGRHLFDPAAIERKMPGTELTTGDREGWSWAELDLIDERAGGATRAQRDALKLLAAFLQHGDNKPAQQRLVCLDDSDVDGASCIRPFMMINDLGLTFGRANFANTNVTGSVNLRAWSETPVWKDTDGCVANISKSFTGTLKDPVIGDEGRRFLAELLVQLSDSQLHDLFELARVDLRPRSPKSARSGLPTIDEWVDVFKQKRAEIVNRRCAE